MQRLLADLHIYNISIGHKLCTVCIPECFLFSYAAHPKLISIVIFKSSVWIEAF